MQLEYKNKGGTKGAIHLPPNILSLFWKENSAPIR